MTNTNNNFILDIEKQIFIEAITARFKVTVTPYDLQTSLNEYSVKMWTIDIITVKKATRCLKKYLKAANLDKFFCAGYGIRDEKASDPSALTQYDVKLRIKKKYINTDELKLALTAYKLGSLGGI